MGTLVVMMLCGGIVVPYGDGWQMNVVEPCCRCMWVSGCNIVIDKACNRTEPDDPDDGEENLQRCGHVVLKCIKCSSDVA